MFRCTTNRYDELYARWLGKPGLLLDLAGYEPDMKLLDLCGGSGVVSREALRRGAMTKDILLYDLNPRCPDIRVPQLTGDVNKCPKIPRGPFDMIVMRQAANYLIWEPRLVAWIQDQLVPEGRFVFNTFVHPLEGRVKPYSYKTYVFEGHRFVEAHIYYNGWVMHLQARLTGRPGFDVTQFRYLDSEDLLRFLHPRFDVAEHRDGRSIRWVCTKNKPTLVA